MQNNGVPSITILANQQQEIQSVARIKFVEMAVLDIFVRIYQPFQSELGDWLDTLKTVRSAIRDNDLVEFSIYCETNNEFFHMTSVRIDWENHDILVNKKNRFSIKKDCSVSEQVDRMLVPIIDRARREITVSKNRKFSVIYCWNPAKDRTALQKKYNTVPLPSSEQSKFSDFRINSECVNLELENAPELSFTMLERIKKLQE